MSWDRSEREEAERIQSSWTGEARTEKEVDDLLDARNEADYERWDDWERRRV